MDVGTKVISEGRDATLEERYHRIMELISQYQMDILFAITLRQHTSIPCEKDFQRNIEYIDKQSDKVKYHVMEVMEKYFVDVPFPAKEVVPKPIKPIYPKREIKH